MAGSDALAEHKTILILTIMKTVKHIERLIKSHTADFVKWRRRHPREVVNTPEEAGITTTLKVGDKVTFTNMYDEKFPNLHILGFCKPILIDHCVYLDYDYYWFPVSLDELKLEE